MSYDIYFNNRKLRISSLESNESSLLSGEFIVCKNTKSFDNVYTEFINNLNIETLNLSSPIPAAMFEHLKKKFKIIKAAGGAVFNHKDELLIIKRLGVWDLPKGKIEKGEKKKAAAIREVQEECGLQEINIESKIGKTYHTYQMGENNILKLTHWYKMSYTGNELPKPQIEEDITEVKWIEKNELSMIYENTYSNLLMVFEAVQNG